jgi:hypothetical protein
MRFDSFWSVRFDSHSLDEKELFSQNHATRFSLADLPGLWRKLRFSGLRESQIA